MAKMVLSMDGLVLKEIELNKERITIGRRPHNDVVIDNLAVSGEHAVVVTILKDSFLEDMGSTNGTMVNGQPIKKHVLQNNDVVELGKYKLKYVIDSSKPAVAVDAGQSTQPVSGQNTESKAGPTSSHGNSIFGSQVNSLTGATVSGTTASGGINRQAVIQILNGANAGKELVLSKALTTLGRPGVQVAVITKRPQGYFITHVEGSSFPVVNGKVLGAEAHPVNDHDIIELSGTKMEFFYQ